MTTALSRRHLLTAALATGAAVPLGVARGAAAAPGQARITLPKPTGPYRVGTVALHLVDRSRRRELMASIWYPAARDTRRHPVAPWMPDASWHALVAAIGMATDAAAPLTAGRVGAPVLRSRDRFPVVLYSHGNGSCRAETTIVVQELTSHGYVVVTVDHTDDGFSEFPDGRVTVPTENSFTPWDYARDMTFVLDRLEDLAAGRNPDAEHRPLPAGLGAALDLRRIGMFGWSKGATSTALVMNVDRRVRAGIGFDGEMQSQPPVTGIDRPFLVMSAEFPRATEESVARFWSLLRGWRLNLQACGAAHGSYNDQQWLIPQLAELTDLSDEELAGWVGTLKPSRAVRIQQAYPLAFFDLHLRHRGHLLDGPSPAFPEVHFIP
ncbi:alpha/beta hydrolase family protein [Actinoplanes friuliensis]|uniref:Lipase n=1 Tax=Actinoplanes friuliensis DSM 7358 TaxID=1246995 RepID=U5W0V9_9ACTN|nr:lipase [Actinoplanes friuliensis]AGZ42898.1 lipase [Actinoplanes friuliensis DSM 7358]